METPDKEIEIDETEKVTSVLNTENKTTKHYYPRWPQ